MKQKGFIKAAGVAGILFLCGFFVCCYLKSEAFMSMAGAMTAEKAQEMLGVRVDVGGICVESLHSLSVKNIAIYDKQAECIARAEDARVGFRLLSVFYGEPAAAVSEVTLSHAEVQLREKDGHWNVEDISTDSEQETAFRGTVRVEDSDVTLTREGKALSLSNVSCTLDMSSYPAMKVKAQAENQGAKLQAEGVIGKDRQILSAEVSDANLMNYLSFLPEGVLPKNVKIISGRVKDGKASLLYQNNVLSFTGQAVYENGEVQVEGTDIRDIRGNAFFTDRELLLSTDAEAAGQKAHVEGSLRLDTGSPYMDLDVSSDSFDPGEVLSSLPLHGAVDFHAKVKGTFENPSVEGDFHTDSLTAENILVQNASAHVHFADNIVSVEKLNANVFGGNVTGSGELSLEDFSYLAHVVTKNVELSALPNALPELSGKASADIGISGRGFDRENIEVYGSADVHSALYRGLPILRANTSFCMTGNDIMIDYLSVQMPNHSSVGLEGEIHGENLALSFYGGHVDLSLLSHLIPQADVTGWGDFKGEIAGNLRNPEIDVKLSCLKGTLFQQPFDSMKAALGGSLGGAEVREFSIERNGKEVWTARGSVGFVGEKKIDLTVETVGARMEDIVAPFADDLKLTGDVDNIIHVTGTLEHPMATGFLKMHRGSYEGILLTGAEGDYFLDGDKVYLKDFHVFSPMIDLDANGALDTTARTMDVKVSVHDIDMKRIQHKLPYEVEGHGTFEGEVKGAFDDFDIYGLLDAPSLVLNGQVLEKVHGLVQSEGDWLRVKEFSFLQGDGSCSMAAGINGESEELEGSVQVRDMEISSVAAILNRKNELLEGKISANVSLGGVLDNPSIDAAGSLQKGSIGGYDIHAVDFEGSFADKEINVKKFKGAQGMMGSFDGTAVIKLDGPMKGHIEAQDLEMGLFTKLAGLDAKVTGTADMDIVLGGFTKNPSAEIQLLGKNGGVKGSAFDSLEGNFSLQNGLVTVNTLSAKKAVAGKNYSLYADGVVPLRALSESEDEKINDYEQMKMNFYLDDAALDLLPLLSDHIDWAVGETDGTVRLTGTLAHPLLHGSIQVLDGSVKIKELEKPITNMKIDVQFDGTEHRIVECSGNMGNGSYLMNGSVLMEGRKPKKYDLEFKANELDIESSVFRGPLSAEFSIKEGELKLSDHTVLLPKLMGKIDLERCLISIPTLPDAEGELPHALLDVSLNVGKKVHFYSPYLCDMYLTGNAHFGGTTRFPTPSGTIEVKHGGTISYLKTIFNIREGSVSFNQVGSFLPSVSLFADTRLSQARVYLWANGALGGDRLKFVLTSSPQMSQTEIMNLLMLRNAYKNGGTVDMGTMLSMGLQMSVLSELEGSMKQLLYLDTFTISRGDGSAYKNAQEDDAYTLTMGKYLSDKVMLKYTHGFGTSDVRRYGVVYEISDKFGVSLERDHNNTIFGIESHIKF